MVTALIDKDGVVQNTILVGDNYNPPNGLKVVEVPDNAAIGDSFIKGELIKLPVIEVTPEDKFVELMKNADPDVKDYVKDLLSTEKTDA